MARDVARGVIQTHVKKFLDGATKTKMGWIEGSQEQINNEKPWVVRFSSAYPDGLGKGEKGLADRDGFQITIDRPSFVIWFHRNNEWQQKPTFAQLWDDVKARLHLHPVEIDLLFTKESDFQTDPFIEQRPDRTVLVNFIKEEKDKGTGVDILKAPNRLPFSDSKIKRIISSHSKPQNDNWCMTTSPENEALEVLNQTKALILVGPPGTGKTRFSFDLANKIVDGDASRVHLFQFHASYAYEDFIEALQPRPENGQLKFEPVLKRFGEVCQLAMTTPQVVILDELNRADVSRVFGEAFVLLEDSYRDQKYAIPRLYNPTEKFWIPPQLYVIATMNNLDKSTYDLDFAFRRRFGQVEVLPDASKLEEILKQNDCTDEDFIRIMRSAFQEIQIHYPLGHAYFKNVKDRVSLVQAYRRVIRPTIEAFLGQFRADQLSKVDAIIKLVCDSPNWESYINVEEE